MNFSKTAFKAVKPGAKDKWEDEDEETAGSSMKRKVKRAAASRFFRKIKKRLDPDEE